jgi:hypothetical protein
MIWLVQARVYHAGDKYYVEVDIIMGRDEKLKVTHDVAGRLKREREGTSLDHRAHYPV